MSERNDAYRIKLYQDEVARCVHRLFDEGHAATLDLMDVSVRDPQSGIVVTTPKPGFLPMTDPDDLHGTDMAVVDIDGNVVYDITPPNDNIGMHLAIYKARPEVTAIIHSFPTYCGVFSSNKRGIPFAFVEQGYMTDFDYSGGISSDVVTMPKADTQEYYDELIEKFHGTKFVMMHDNGSVSVGSNVDEALNYLAWMEEVAQKIYRASLIGDVQWIG